MAIAYRRILVTGAGGFVGRHLVRRLTEVVGQYASIVAADRNGQGAGGADHIPFDLLDPASIDAAIRDVRPDLVFHLAGQASVAGAASAEAGTWRVNVGGSVELALALKAHAHQAAMVFASSAEVYGRSFLTGPVSEDTPPRPASVYARSKLVAEAVLGEILPTDARVAIVRPSNHIGPGQDERFALPSFAAQIARAEAVGEPARIRVGNLAAERDFMDVRDVVDGYVALAGALPGLKTRTIVNLSSGTTRSLRSLLDQLRALARVDTEVEVDPARFRTAEIPVAAVRPDRMHALTGWSPLRSCEDTLAAILIDARDRSPAGGGY